MRLVILSLLALSICSCKNDPNAVDFDNPESVVRAYSKSLAEFDFAKVAQYCTAKSRPLIESMGEYLNKMHSDTLQNIKTTSQEIYGHIQTITCTDNGTDIKSCTTCCEKDGKPSNLPIILKRENGKWLVYNFKGINVDRIPDTETDSK